MQSKVARKFFFCYITIKSSKKGFFSVSKSTVVDTEYTLQCFEVLKYVNIYTIWWLHLWTEHCPMWYAHNAVLKMLVPDSRMMVIGVDICYRICKKSPAN